LGWRFIRFLAFAAFQLAFTLFWPLRSTRHLSVSMVTFVCRHLMGCPALTEDEGAERARAGGPQGGEEAGDVCIYISRDFVR
jgi:hypothetical protein